MRLIDADELLTAFPVDDEPMLTKSCVRLTIQHMPTIEPQSEIIQCKECIHWKHSAVRKSYCEVFDWMSKAKDFCSFAERKTDER